MTLKLNVLSLASALLASGSVAACVSKADVTWDGQDPSALEGSASINLRSHRVLTLPGLGDVSDLRLLDDASVLLVAGTCGFAEVELAGWSVQRGGTFDLPCPPFLPSRIVDADGDGELEFARFSAGWTGPTALLDREGRVRWKNSKPARCDEVLDVDGDGRIEVLVANANSETVELLDHQGRTLWRRGFGSFYQVVGLDTDGDGTQELLLSDGKKVRIYSSDGRGLRCTRPTREGFVNFVQIARFGTSTGDAQVVVGAYHSNGPEAGQSYYTYARDARTLLRHKRTGNDVLQQFTATVPSHDQRGELHLLLNNEKEQAFPAGFKASELVLYVVDRSGERLGEYRFSKPGKKLARADGALLVLQAAPLRILVGYGDSLWELVEEA